MNDLVVVGWQWGGGGGVITLCYCLTQDTQTRRYDQILVLTHLQEREEIDKQKL